MNYIVILAQYGLTSIRETISKMHQPVTLLIKRNDGSWVNQTSLGHTTRISEPKFKPNDVVVRWGNSIPFSGSFVAYNTPGPVSIASDKGQFRKTMLDSEIPIPTPFYKDNTNYPIIVRPLHHHAGQHFYVAKNPDRRAHV